MLPFLWTLYILINVFILEYVSHPDFSQLDQTHLNYAHTPTKEILHTENEYRIRF